MSLHKTEFSLPSSPGEDPATQVCSERHDEIWVTGSRRCASARWWRI